MKFEKCFENITCPVLILPSEAEWKLDEIKSSKVVVIPGGKVYNIQPN